MGKKLDLLDVVDTKNLQSYYAVTGRAPANPKEPWQDAMKHAVSLFVEQVILTNNAISADHVTDTAKRYVEALESMTSGCKEDPTTYLSKAFSIGDYDEMVVVDDLRIVSICAHHLLPVFGKASFAYIPSQSIVGLSKISRFIGSLTKRPQVQEELAVRIVDLFQETVQPAGCAVQIKAYHGCMLFRGVEESRSFTTTTALRGVFKDASVKAEFLKAADKDQVIFP
jgi:GTP cyclohydrolase I